jgi:hypothetical protein
MGPGRLNFGLVAAETVLFLVVILNGPPGTHADFYGNISENMTPEELRRRIIELEVEHSDLNAVIDVLICDPRHEELQLRRLKKRKLQLKDNITLLKMQLVPDIPA